MIKIGHLIVFLKNLITSHVTLRIHDRLITLRSAPQHLHNKLTDQPATPSSTPFHLVPSFPLPTDNFSETIRKIKTLWDSKMQYP